MLARKSVFVAILAGLLFLAMLTNGEVVTPAGAQTKKDEKKDEKKEEPKVEVKKDERVYPKVDPILEIKGHSDWVNRVQITKNGKQLVTASRDKSLRIWDADSGKEVLVIKDLPAAAAALALSPDGGKLATSAGKWNKDKQQWIGEVNLYDMKSGKLIKTLQGHTAQILAAAFLPKDALATASADGTIRIWNMSSSKELHELKGHSGPVTAIALSPYHKLLASGGEDKTVKIWDASSGNELKTLKGPARAISSLDFSRDGKLLAAASHDGTVTLWDTSDWNVLRVVKSDDGLLAVAISPDGSKLATGGWANVVQIWDTATGAEIGGMAGHMQPISSVTFNDKGDRVVSASLDQTVRVWHVSAAKPKAIPK